MQKKLFTKGQVEHAFVIIIFILVAGFVLLLGYKAINKLLYDSCSLEKTNFQEDIRGFFEKYDGFGAVHFENIRLPCNYHTICFVDSEVYLNEIIGASWSPQDPLVQGNPGRQSVIFTARDVEFNIFLIGEFAEPVSYSRKVMVNNSGARDLCVEAKGTANLVFRGKGKKTLVEER